MDWFKVVKAGVWEIGINEDEIKNGEVFTDKVKTFKGFQDKVKKKIVWYG